MPTEPAGSIRGNWRQDSRCIQEAGREYSIQNYIDAQILLSQCLCVVRGYFLTCTRGQLGIYHGRLPNRRMKSALSRLRSYCSAAVNAFFFNSSASHGCVISLLADLAMLPASYFGERHVTPCWQNDRLPIQSGQTSATPASMASKAGK